MSVMVLVACLAGATRLAGEIESKDLRHQVLGSRTDQTYTTEQPDLESGIIGVLNAIRFGPDGAKILEEALGKGTRAERLRLALDRFRDDDVPGDGQRLAEIYHKLVVGVEGWEAIEWTDLRGAPGPLDVREVHGRVAASMGRKIPVIVEFRRFVLRRKDGQEAAALEWQPAGTLYTAVESVATTCAKDAAGFFLERVCPRTGKKMPRLAGLPQRSLGPKEAWSAVGIDPARLLETTGPGWDFAESTVDWQHRTVVLLTGIIGGR